MKQRRIPGKQEFAERCARGVELIRGATYEQRDDTGLQINVGSRTNAVPRVLQPTWWSAPVSSRAATYHRAARRGRVGAPHRRADVAAELDAKRVINPSARLAAKLRATLFLHNVHANLWTTRCTTREALG